MIGNLTRAIAQQAIGDQAKKVVESLRPPDLSTIAESIVSPKAPPSPEGGLSAMIVGQVQAMQSALKEDQELLVVCTAGLEALRVLEIFIPSPDVLVLTGIDTEKAITRIVTPANAIQLVCKPVAAQPGSKPARIRFVVPRPKE